MLKNKDLHQKFGIGLKTLFNWSTSRPELYNFLKNSDDYYDKARDLNLILRAYENTITITFSKDELYFLLELDYKDKPTSLFQNFEETFLELCGKKLGTCNKLILSIVKKLSTMSLIEKYLLLDKIYTYQLKRKSKTNTIDMNEYFNHLFASVLK